MGFTWRRSEKITAKLNGFNSIFATSSIDMAKLYYNEFRKQLAESGRKTQDYYYL